MAGSFKSHSVLIKILFFGFWGLSINIAFASSFPQNFRNNSKILNPYIPHTYLSGYHGDGASTWLGKVDALAPMLLRDDRNLFLYGQARYSDYANYGDSKPYSASFGVGFRQIVNSEYTEFDNSQLFSEADQVLLKDEHLYGAHILVDYVNSPSGYKYWDLSPGFERLGTVDIRINGYIPLKRSYVETVGEKFDHFYGHDEYYHLYKNYEEQGMGIDAEIGVQLFSIRQMPIKGYVNGYMFGTESSGQIKGVGGRITIQPTRYLTFEFKNVYDDVQHYVWMGGIKLYLNGLAQGLANTNVNSHDIKSRLFETIERNFASIGSGVTMPYAHGQEHRETFLYRDQIIFVTDPETTGITGNGTYEEPYVYGESADFQEIVDAAHAKFHDYSYLFVAPGTYDMGNNAISLHNHQLIFGRSSDFSEPANFGDVKFIGAFHIVDTMDAEFHNFQLLNRFGAFAYGIDIDGAQPAASIVFDGVIIGEGTDGVDPTNNGFPVGVYIHDINTGSATFDINNSSFYGIGSSALHINGMGMWVDNNHAIDSNIILGINNSSFYGFYDGWPRINGDSSGLGIYNYSTGAVRIANINNSTFIADAMGLSFESESEVATINIGNITSSYFNGFYEGIYLYNYASMMNVNIGNIDSSQFIGVANDGMYIGASGYSSDHLRSLIQIGNVNNTVFRGNDTGIYIRAWDSYYQNILIGDITASKFEATSNNGSYGGIFVNETGNATINCIKDSTFYGGIEGTGLYIAALFDLNIPNIENSKFEALDASYGWGMYVFATNINIANISNSSFGSNSGNNDIGLYLGGNYDATDLTHITIGNIKNSTFTVRNGDNYGSALFVEVENLLIGNISDSTFENYGSFGFGLNADHWGHNTAHDLRILNIENSTFYTSGSDSIAMNVGGYYNDQNPDQSHVEITIGNITNSVFDASGVNARAMLIGLYLPNSYHELNVDATIGDIVDSTFTANGDVGTAVYFGKIRYVFYPSLSITYTPINEVSIGNIQNSTFSANDVAGKELWFNANQVMYGDPSIQYTDPQGLYDALMPDNNFVLTDGKYICITGSCYPL